MIGLIDIIGPVNAILLAVSIFTVVALYSGKDQAPFSEWSQDKYRRAMYVNSLFSGATFVLIAGVLYIAFQEPQQWHVAIAVFFGYFFHLFTNTAVRSRRQLHNYN